MDGFLNILKPPGMTSFDVVAFLRKLLKIKKIGHLGTLDPGAAGVLPIAIGKATRFLEYLLNIDKSYLAEITFGKKTTSDDEFGTIIAQEEKPFILPSEKEIRGVLAGFIGTFDQIPPIYSAIKINGTPAYNLARKNQFIYLKPRTVTIHKIELLARRKETILFEVHCSKGTYIRSLCRDIGERIGILATMSFLLRNRVGQFYLENSYTLEEIETLAVNGMLKGSIITIDKCLLHLPRYDLPSNRKKAFINGLSTRISIPKLSPNTIFRVYVANDFLGIGSIEQATASIVPLKVYKATSE